MISVPFFTKSAQNGTQPVELMEHMEPRQQHPQQQELFRLQQEEQQQQNRQHE